MDPGGGAISGPGDPGPRHSPTPAPPDPTTQPRGPRVYYIYIYIHYWSGQVGSGPGVPGPGNGITTPILAKTQTRERREENRIRCRLKWISLRISFYFLPRVWPGSGTSLIAYVCQLPAGDLLPAPSGLCLSQPSRHNTLTNNLAIILFKPYKTLKIHNSPQT